MGKIADAFQSRDPYTRYHATGSILARGPSDAADLRALFDAVGDSGTDNNAHLAGGSDPWGATSDGTFEGTVGRHAEKAIERLDHRSLPSLVALAPTDPRVVIPIGRVVRRSAHRASTDALRAALPHLAGATCEMAELVLAVRSGVGGAGATPGSSGQVEGMMRDFDLEETREVIPVLAGIPLLRSVLGYVVARADLPDDTRGFAARILAEHGGRLDGGQLDAIEAAAPDDPEVALTIGDVLLGQGRRAPWHPRLIVETLFDAAGGAPLAADLVRRVEGLAGRLPSSLAEDAVALLSLTSDPGRRRLILGLLGGHRTLGDPEVEALLERDYRALLGGPRASEALVELGLIPRILGRFAKDVHRMAERGEHLVELSQVVLKLTVTEALVPLLLPHLDDPARRLGALQVLVRVFVRGKKERQCILAQRDGELPPALRAELAKWEARGFGPPG